MPRCQLPASYRQRKLAVPESAVLPHRVPASGIGTQRHGLAFFCVKCGRQASLCAPCARVPPRIRAKGRGGQESTGAKLGLQGPGRKPPEQPCPRFSPSIEVEVCHLEPPPQRVTATHTHWAVRATESRSVVLRISLVGVWAPPGVRCQRHDACGDFLLLTASGYGTSPMRFRPADA